MAFTMSRMMLSSLASGLLCSCFFALSQAAYRTNYPSHDPQSTYFSRPDLIAPKFLLTVNDKASVTPGYLLLTPITQPLEASVTDGLGGFTFSSNASAGTPQQQLAAYFAQAIQNGPYIYDTNGELIYSGFGNSGGLNADNLKIAQYQGAPHLTYFNGDDQLPLQGSRGHGVIMNSKYQTVATVTAGLGRTGNDEHEFTVLEDGTAIVTIYQPTQYDLSSYGINEPIGWVVEAIFQRIDIQTGSVLFEWRSLDHTTPADSYLPLGSDSGVGASAGNPYDYFHINSVELDQGGNYIVSARHLSAIFYVSGADGSVIWQLNGKQSDFSFIDFNNTFAFQHHARIRSQNTTHLEVSLFDNGSNGENTTSSASSGMIISVDQQRKTATLQKQFFLPNGGVLSTSQGNVQPLSKSSSTGSSDGNVFIGWGGQPFVSEHTSNGTAVFIGQFAAQTGLAFSYRAFKIGLDAWHGQPESTPALWVFANSTSSTTSTTFYVSWNGATEVSSWRFYGANITDPTSDAYNTTLVSTQEATVLGELSKTGFETTFIADGYYPAGFASALDKQGNVLGESPIRITYVPFSGNSTRR